MSIWMEIRCSKAFDPQCVSASNNGPMELYRDGRQSASKAFTVLRNRALKAGWRQVNGDLVCPHCYRDGV